MRFVTIILSEASGMIKKKNENSRFSNKSRKKSRSVRRQPSVVLYDRLRTLNTYKVAMNSSEDRYDTNLLEQHKHIEY